MKGYRFVCALVVWVSGIALAPAEAAEIALVPVDAGTDHVIDGQEITVFTGDTTVTLELRVSGWDPDLDGAPVLRSYQAQLDSSGFTSGDSGTVAIPLTPCTSGADCGADSICLWPGFCKPVESVYVDVWHPDYVFYGLPTIAVVGGIMPDITLTSLATIGGLPDPGKAKYAGTVVLDVSSDARGTFTVGFLPGDGPSGTIMVDTAGQYIEPLTLSPARITVSIDCNRNGIPDEQDIAEETSNDCNGNGRPDECEPDCNENQVADSCDISGDTSVDCNDSGVPDECESDCNENGIADECDVVEGTSDDCNENDVPDECETGWDEDCNRNDFPDLCDIHHGTSGDCNANAVPDECDIPQTSRDCTHNGIPDECEPDCNQNGVADSCDIQRHTSEDTNGDGRPDECVRGLALMPTSASGGHLIDGNEIIVPIGGTMVTIEMRVSGWDPDLDGGPELNGYQVTFDSSGLTSGDTGFLSLSTAPCSDNDDCFAGSLCQGSGFCDAWDAVHMDVLHPTLVFAGLSPFAALDHSLPDFRLGCSAGGGPYGAEDPGVPRYAATLTFDVSPDATGTFTIGLHPSSSYLTCVDGPCGADEIRPAMITILDDCNENGVRDDIDIAEGTSDDLDGNGVPDECELTLPSVWTDGSRYLMVTPAPGDEPVALRVTSPQFPCFHKYVRPDSGTARLVDVSTYQTPAEWGTVTIIDPLVVPGTTYQVRAEVWGGPISLGAAATTSGWGDAIAPWGEIDSGDVAAVVDRFESLSGGPPIQQVDMYPSIPDGVIDVRDLTLTVDALNGSGYPLGLPCR